MIRVLENGKLLIFSPNARKLYVYDPKEDMSEEKDIGIPGMNFMTFLQVVHSFLSLKHHIKPF